MMVVVMMMMMMMMILILIIIALKGAFRDFYNLLTAPRTVSNTHAQAVRAQSCATRIALITCNMSNVTRYDGTAQLLSLAEFKSHLF